MKADPLLSHRDGHVKCTAGLQLTLYRVKGFFPAVIINGIAVTSQPEMFERAKRGKGFNGIVGNVAHIHGVGPDIVNAFNITVKGTDIQHGNADLHSQKVRNKTVCARTDVINVFDL